METKITKNVSNEKIVYTFASWKRKKRELILQASEIYMRYGIKSMTMDEMARQLGVSKKDTVSTCEGLKTIWLLQCLLLQHTEEQKMIAEVIQSTENAIEQMLRISRIIIEELRNIHPSIFFDLAKYHPSAMKMMDGHKEEFICGCIVENLVVGIKQGLYRENLNPEVHI